MKLMIAVLIGLAVQGFLSPPCTAQGLILIPRDTTLTGSLGNEFVFDVLIRNGSASPLGVSVRRIENQILPGWQSSLCFGTACFPPGVDSIATTRTFGSGPLNPGDSLDFSVHMTALTTPGLGTVAVLFRNLNQPAESYTVRFRADAVSSSVGHDLNLPGGFALAQNYPNPFNPSTRIRYSVGSSSVVDLRAYDLLGREVAVLVDARREPGSYDVQYDCGTLAAGTYIYRLRSGFLSASRTMTLVK